MKKIGITGAQGTGKSQLVSRIYFDAIHAGLHAEIIEELARSCPYPVNDKMTVLSQSWMYSEQIVREFHAGVVTPDLIVCDRTIIDPIIYSWYMFEKTGDPSFKEFVNEKAEFAAAAMREYSPLYFCKIDKRVPIKIDGFRSTDRDFQQKIEDLFLQFFDEHGINFTDSKKYNPQVIKDLEPA